LKKMYQQFKCSQIMLPEHRRELEKHAALKQHEKQESSSTADEQEKEQWDRLLQASLKTGQKIELTILSRNRCREISGSVEKIYSSSGYLLFKTAGGVIKISSRYIISIKE